MHTSTRLCATDFQFWRHSPTGSQPADFATFCPDYHELDRIGVVSPTVEAGVHHTSHALLALTTAFYDSLRARGPDFFDYPQHFAFVGATDGHLCTGNGPLPLDTPNLWDAWSWLDVWPANKWVPTPFTATAMLQRVFDYQINRLFWPRGLQPGPAEPALPPYVWQMLRTRLKAVYNYGAEQQVYSALQNMTIEIHLSAAAGALVQESISRLPIAVQFMTDQRNQQRFAAVDIETFLAALQGPPKEE